MILREEHPADAPAIDALVRAAFAGEAGDGDVEAAIVRALRADGALLLGVVAELDGAIAGHIAFSPVRVDGQDCGWAGLGPLAVRPGHQRQGIGTALVEQGLSILRGRAMGGCVVLGDPAYYGRLGFDVDSRLILPGFAAWAFQCVLLSGVEAPNGAVAYHVAFGTG